ncbi:MAG: rhodanese-like domain-containing protein, partial [Candidatus Hydrothermae bacterium]|nr:rhodanese-like domain-containing protein [Candidatus Hydrothermae bacterium]
WLMVMLLVPMGLQAERLSPQTVAKWLEAREKDKMHFVLIDVRTPQEHAMGFIEGTDTLIPYLNIVKGIRALKLDPQKDTVVVYCRSGHRAGMAEQALRAAGYKHVFNGGGIRQWLQAGYTLVKPQPNKHAEGMGTP